MKPVALALVLGSLAAFALVASRGSGRSVTVRPGEVWRWRATIKPPLSEASAATFAASLDAAGAIDLLVDELPRETRVRYTMPVVAAATVQLGRPLVLFGMVLTFTEAVQVKP